jgi:hypothetical protein
LLLPIVIQPFKIGLGMILKELAGLTGQRTHTIAYVWNIAIRTITGVFSTILSPLLPFLINQETTTFNPNDPNSAPTAYFMSFEWFNVVGMNITMIFIFMILSGIVIEYLKPQSFAQKLLFLRLNLRTVAEHSLKTYMPDKYPLEDRISNIMIMAMVSAIVGCFAPIVFLFFCFYVLVFMSVESSEISKNEYLSLAYVNPEVFKKLVLVIEFSYLLFIITSFLSLLRAFIGVDSTQGSIILLCVLCGVFILIFFVSLFLETWFFRKNSVELRQLDRFGFSFCF